jgi:hypothetical protein
LYFSSLNIITFIDRANPEDPDELSFAKGEVLEMLDQRGNWWRAKKSDGTIGIVPSNYVSTNIYYGNHSKINCVFM